LINYNVKLPRIIGYNENHYFEFKKILKRHWWSGLSLAKYSLIVGDDIGSFLFGDLQMKSGV
jgi:hypothetical protein